MPLTFSQLLIPPTADEIRAKYVSMLVTMNIPADQWRKGGVASSILTVVSILSASASQLIVDGITSQFLETAEGAWLTTLAAGVYNISRGAATFASGPVTLVNAGGGVFNFNPGEVVVQNAFTSKTYANTVPLSLGALSTVTANFQAQTAGSASNANPGDVAILVTQMLGVTVTNASSMVGLDVQSDASLRNSCLAKLGSLTNGGPKNAYQAAVDIAVNSVSGLLVNVNRRNVQTDPLTGTVHVIAASPSGPVTATDITGIINSIVDVAVPDAVSFTVQSASAVSYSPTITVWAQGLGGIDGPTLAQSCADAITAYIEAYPIGGLSKGATSKFWATGLEGAIKDVNAAIFAVDGCTDLILGPADVAVDNVPTPIIQLVRPP